MHDAIRSRNDAFAARSHLLSSRTNGILITTMDKAENTLEGRVYQIGQANPTHMRALLLTCINHEWADKGGLGRIDTSQMGTLVITHSQQAHEEINLMFAQMIRILDKSQRTRILSNRKERRRAPRCGDQRPLQRRTQGRRETAQGRNAGHHRPDQNPRLD